MRFSLLFCIYERYINSIADFLGYNDTSFRNDLAKWGGFETVIKIKKQGQDFTFSKFIKTTKLSQAILDLTRKLPLFYKKTYMAEDSTIGTILLKFFTFIIYGQISLFTDFCWEIWKIRVLCNRALYEERSLKRFNLIQCKQSSFFWHHLLMYQICYENTSTNALCKLNKRNMWADIKWTDMYTCFNPFRVILNQSV